MRLGDLPTPALVVSAAALARNIATMASARPGAALRPHVKAHKCTTLARQQAAAGHEAFTCATVFEALGMARAGLGTDLLLANEVLDDERLRMLAQLGGTAARLTITVDSAETIEAASAARLTEVLVDVNVGVPRCGCDPADAGHLADLARAKGLEVRGVMGYEGHVVGLADRESRRSGASASMELLARAHADVGGDVISAGGTGTYDLNQLATEIQAGSYVLMDTAYRSLDIPFEPALWVWATVISASPEWAVCDAGAKALGMDHGNPAIDGATVWFCSDEHTTFSPPLPVGTKVQVWPAHVDPTVAYHAAFHIASGGDDPAAVDDPSDREILETWPIDLRGW